MSKLSKTPQTTIDVDSHQQQSLSAVRESSSKSHKQHVALATQALSVVLVPASFCCSFCCSNPLHSQDLSLVAVRLCSSSSLVAARLYSSNSFVAACLYSSIMATLSSVMKDYDRAMEPGYAHYDIWWKVASAVKPVPDFISEQVFHKLRAKYWVAHPALHQWSQFPRYEGEKQGTSWNRHTPYTDIAEFNSGAVWTIAHQGYMSEINSGCVPSYTSEKMGGIAVIDCRSGKKNAESQHGGWMEFPDDGTKAPFPGPWPEDTPFMQFHTNAACKVGTDGRSTQEMTHHFHQL